MTERSAANSSCVVLHVSLDLVQSLRTKDPFVLQARHSSGGAKYNFGVILRMAKLHSMDPVDGLVQPIAKPQHILQTLLTS